MAAATAFNWKRFFVRLYERSFDADIFSRSAQVAFYFSFALFPLLYFLVSLFGIVLDSAEGLKTELLSYLRQIMPYTVFALVSKTIDELIINSTGGKALIGLVVALWSASAGVDAMRVSLNAIYHLKETRPWWRTKIGSLIFTSVVATLMFIVVAIVFYGWQLVQLASAGIGLEVNSPFVLITIQWVSILLVMLFACEIIYNLLPDFKDRKWIWITYGSIVAIILWLVMTTGFRVYLGYFNTYNKTYGSLGAVIIMMLWLYLTAIALMVGGSINAVLNEFSDTDPDPLANLHK